MLLRCIQIIRESRTVFVHVLLIDMTLRASGEYPAFSSPMHLIRCRSCERSGVCGSFAVSILRQTLKAQLGIKVLLESVNLRLHTESVVVHRHQAIVLTYFQSVKIQLMPCHRNVTHKLH